MGVVDTITADTFPRQDNSIGLRAEVCFGYDTSRMFPGHIVRDDLEHPFETIIRLDDGRYVRGAECQYMTHAAARN